MSDIMLHGVLNMPLPSDPAELDIVTWLQFKGRARDASSRIEELEAEIEWWKQDSAAAWDKCEDYRVKLAKAWKLFTFWRAEADKRTASIGELEAKLAKALAALDGLVLAFDEQVALPDANCSCHIAPPCGDCEAYSFARDAYSDAVTTLAELTGGNDARADQR